ncbi:MAG: hypothetical protein KAG84_07470 [Bacteroidales bacterium]|nr:hypothetical protein [Bacteroidales bacterium]
MKYIKLTILLFSIFVFTNCDNLDYPPIKNTEKLINDSVNIIDSNQNTPFRIQILKTSNNKNIVFKISNPLGVSLTNVVIIGANFEDKSPITLNEIDPISKIQLYDINNDGFDELFIFTQSAGSGSYGNIYAFTSTKGMQLKPIIIDDFIFDGYIGHDLFTFNNDKLIRTFTIENDGIKEKASVTYYDDGDYLRRN